MPEAVTRIRIFISSPGDVQEERDALEALIKEDLQQTLGQQNNLYLEPLRWETHATPGMGDAQQKVFAEMGPYDIFVGIFWKRFGTSTSEHESGSEAEFRDAYARWEEDNSRPILMYFCERPFLPTAEDLEQYGKVLAFRKEIEGKGLYARYTELNEFEKLLRKHLYKIIPRVAASELHPQKGQPKNDPAPATTVYHITQNITSNSGNVVGVQHTGNASQDAVEKPDKKTAAARRHYLEQLHDKWQLLPLAAMGADRSTEDAVTLEDVYINLNTTEVKKSKRRNQEAQQDETPLSAMEAVETTNLMVLLGAPGSGKTTFLNQIIVRYTESLLEENTVASNAPPGLLPVKIVLRELAQRLMQDGIWKQLTTIKRKKLAGLLLEQAVEGLAELDAEDFREGLIQSFREKRCMLLLDGLDEVPQVLRETVREVVRAAISLYRPPRVLVTCRIRSYQDEAGQIPGLKSYTLAPFTKDQKEQFSKAWYKTPINRSRFGGKEAGIRASQLAKAATEGPLSSLASNPMLLTTMAIIHQGEVGLPDERVKLYLLAVDVLMRKWQRAKAGAEGDEINEDLRRLLKDDRKLRKTLTRLAYEAHRVKSEAEAAADLSRKEAVHILESDEYLGDLSLIGAFLDYVDSRAGLLIGQGGGGSKPLSYSFPHRTFQEYLAGCYLIGLPNASGALVDHAKEGDYWYEAVKLGLEELLHNGNREWELIDMAYRFSPQTFPESIEHQRLVLWAGFITKLVGPETIQGDTRFPDQGPAFLERIRNQLVMLFEGKLTVIEKAEAGRLLGYIGDPDLGLTTTEHMPLCYVPAGPYLRGDDKVETDVDYDYWIGKYPVTQAQFKIFVDEGGYKTRKWWSSEGWQEKEKRVWGNRAAKGEVFDLLNHPVVGVSWYEAEAYAKWLAAKGVKEGWLAEGMEIRLPNNDEYEKAARGGVEVPLEVIEEPLNDLKEVGDISWKENDNPGRRYPWGNQIHGESCNYNGSKIGSTSRSGAFPESVSLVGACDTSGNVWEWTLKKSGGLRVIRGGSWASSYYVARCAYRLRFNPHDRYDVVGFRIVVLPFWGAEGNREAGIK